MQLSIPEYISIDRSKLIKKGKILRFVTPQPNGTYKGEVWRYSPNDMVRKVENKINKVIDDSKTFGKTLKVSKGSNGIVAISPDGRYALSGSSDKTIRYWPLWMESMNGDY